MKIKEACFMREKRQLYCSSLDRMVDLHIILPESAGNPNRRCPVLYFYERIRDLKKAIGENNNVIRSDSWIKRLRKRFQW